MSSNLSKRRYPEPSELTTLDVQEYLDENANLILAINQNVALGKIKESTAYLESLQSNLMYLAGRADEQKKSLQASQQQKKQGPTMGLQPSTSWTKEEHQLFIGGLQRFGVKDLDSVARMVGTKTTEEVNSYLRNYLIQMRLRQQQNNNTQSQEDGYLSRSLRLSGDDPRPALSRQENTQNTNLSSQNGLSNETFSLRTSANSTLPTSSTRSSQNSLGPSLPRASSYPFLSNQTSSSADVVYQGASTSGVQIGYKSTTGPTLKSYQSTSPMTYSSSSPSFNYPTTMPTTSYQTNPTVHYSSQTRPTGSIQVADQTNTLQNISDISGLSNTNSYLSTTQTKVGTSSSLYSSSPGALSFSSNSHNPVTMTNSNTP